MVWDGCSPGMQLPAFQADFPVLLRALLMLSACSIPDHVLQPSVLLRLRVKLNPVSIFDIQSGTELPSQMSLAHKAPNQIIVMPPSHVRLQGSGEDMNSTLA